jgi:hypothetical protein
MDPFMKGGNTREEGEFCFGALFSYGRTVLLVLLEELVGGLYYWFCLRSLLEDCHRGAPVAGNFGLGG